MAETEGTTLRSVPVLRIIDRVFEPDDFPSNLSFEVVLKSMGVEVAFAEAKLKVALPIGTYSEDERVADPNTADGELVSAFDASILEERDRVTM